MNLIRIIALGLVIWLVLSMIKQYKRRLQSDPAKQSRKESVDNARVVQCHHCGVHVPENEALVKPDGKVYCSPECAKAD